MSPFRSFRVFTMVVSFCILLTFHNPLTYAQSTSTSILGQTVTQLSNTTNTLIHSQNVTSNSNNTTAAPVQGTASTLDQTVQAATDTLGNTINNTTGPVGTVGNTLNSSVDSTVSSVGSSVDSIGSSLKQTAGSVEDATSDVTKTVNDTLHSIVPNGNSSGGKQVSGTSVQSNFNNQEATATSNPVTTGTNTSVIPAANNGNSIPGLYPSNPQGVSTIQSLPISVNTDQEANPYITKSLAPIPNQVDNRYTYIKYGLTALLILIMGYCITAFWKNLKYNRKKSISN